MDMEVMLGLSLYRVAVLPFGSDESQEARPCALRCSKLKRVISTSYAAHNVPCSVTSERNAIASVCNDKPDK